MDFLAPSPSQPQPRTQSAVHPGWCVLIVDDEPEVHAVTRLALRGFEFQQQKIELLSALSAAEAREIFNQRDDIALALVDVVMETEHAGLDLIRDIRDVRNNRKTRLVLRTGQAGQAPEDRVIRDYEIDDYKEKTELTTQKLRTLLYSSLRAYRDICIIEAQRDGLRRVLESCSAVQNSTTFKQFASAVLGQLTALLNLGHSALYCMELPADDSKERESRILAATGDFVRYITGAYYEALPPEVAARCKDAIDLKRSRNYDDAYVLYMPGRLGGSNLLYVCHYQPLSALDKQLLELYVRNVAITFENISLFDDFQETAKELVYTLADAVEARSRETGAHVLRVALISERLAELYGLPEREVSLIKLASPLHDIGKVAIPDAILHKPGKLSAEEWAIMQKHVIYGVDILKGSRREVMQTGALIAGHHHEKWDGSGYPAALSGEAIPICGRITAIADVFDALGARRSYKEPWPDHQIRSHILAERGKHFDPTLVDLLIEHFEEFVAIREKYPDEDVE